MPDTQLRGADAVHDGELEVGFDEEFERSWRRVARVGRVAMLLVVVAGVTGLMGKGPFSHRTSATADKALAADREPVARYGTGTTVTLHLDMTKFAPGHDWAVHLNRAFVEPMGLQQITPTPLRQAAEGGGGLALLFAFAPDEPDAMIRLTLKPSGVGLQHLAARVGPEVAEWDQVVLP